MIALDASLLVRYLVDDDAERVQAARTLPEGPAAERAGRLWVVAVIVPRWQTLPAWGLTCILVDRPPAS